MGKMSNEELVKTVQKDILHIFEDYSIDVTFKDSESVYGDEGLAFKTNIKPRYHYKGFLMCVEFLEDDSPNKNLRACIEFGEDNWEEFTDEDIWRWLFWEALENAQSENAENTSLKSALEKK